MVIKTMAARTLFAAAALSAFATSANAFVLGLDPQIFINKAIDSPTLTVRYDGASAALIELRINGSSFGTRTVTNSKDSGETNFTISPGDLQTGDNDVEIRLFDRTGKLIAKDHTNISVAAAQAGPVFLSTPKTGDTVRNTVDLNVGFDHDLKDVYVSFFVDGTFKRMTNVPPFTYNWDTQLETNGWHELEAWAIDDSSETHKTAKIKVFVNNPHGTTIRPNVKSSDLSASGNQPFDLVVNNDKSKTRKVIKNAHAVRSGFTPLPPTTPSIGPEVILSRPATAKPMKPADPIAMGTQNMTPTGSRVARAPKHDAVVVKHDSVVVHHDETLAKHDQPKGTSTIASITIHKDNFEAVAMTNQAHVGKIVNDLMSAANLMKISKGSRLPNIGVFEISLDSSFVDFHGVLPRIDDGVPMTPLRFLLEKKGGSVDWDNPTKTVFAKADGSDLTVKIGSIYALLNHDNIRMEKASYLDRGRTIVPLSFMENALHVKIDYDKSSNHMLITSQP